MDVVNIIKSKKLFMAVLAVGILTFGQSFVNVKGVAAPTETNEEILTKVANNFKFNLKSDVEDEQLENARTIQHVRLNIHPKTGSDIEKLFAAYFGVNRIFKYMLKNRPDILERVVGKTLSKEEFANFYNEKDSQVYKKCVDDFFINLFSSINSISYDGVVYNLDKISFQLFKGIVDGANELIKDRAVREELAKPLTDEEKEEFNKLVQQELKIAKNFLDDHNRLKELEMQDFADADKRRKIYEREILCGAKDTIECGKWASAFLTVHDVEEFRLSCRKYLEELTIIKDKLQDKINKKEICDDPPASISNFKSEIDSIQKLLSSDDELKKAFSEMSSKVENGIKEAKNIINSKEELAKAVDDRMGIANGDGVFPSEKGDAKKEILEKNVETFKSVTFEGVQAAYNSVDLLNCENVNFLEPYKGVADKPIKEGAAVDSRIRLIKGIRNSNLKNILNNCVYEKVQFRFPQNMSALSRLCLFSLLKHIICKLCIADFFDEERTLGFHGEDLDFFEAQNGRVYFEGCFGSGRLYVKQLSDFLGAEDGVLSFTVKAKNADDLKKFNDALPGALRNILANLPITKEDVRGSFNGFMQSVAYEYFKRLDAAYNREHKGEVKPKSYSVHFSSLLGNIAKLFAPNLCELIKFDENDEHLKERFSANIHAFGAQSNVDRRELDGLDSDNISLDKNKELLISLLKNVEGLDVNFVDSIKNDGNSFNSFTDLIRKDSCCVRHSNIELKDEVVSSVLAAAESFAKNLPDGGFDLSFEPTEGDAKDKVCCMDENFFVSVNASYHTIGDFSFIKALDKDRGIFEKAKGELLQLRDIFKFLSDKGNVESLTPMQRRDIIFKYLVIESGVRHAVDCSANPFKDAQDLEVESTCSFSAQLDEYVEALLKVINEKLGV